MIHKTGILGGTFDPVHYGHLELAKAAGELCNLSEIVLIPAAVPPHKQYKQITAFSHRVAMLTIALKKSSMLHISTIEQLLPTPSYSIDTLEYLKLHSVGNVDFYFITGADAFLDIQSWKRYQDLLASCHFIVFTRNGNKTNRLHSFLKQLGYKQNATVWYSDKTDKSIFTSAHSLPQISSSDIRKKLYRGESVFKMIPEKVNKYIVSHGLYG